MSTLAAELANDPAGLGYAGMSAAQIEAAINARNRPIVGRLPKTLFASWCGTTGLRAKIEDHAANAQSPLRSAALSVRDVLVGSIDYIDFSYQANVDMLNAWVQAQELTGAQRDALLAMATRTVSRAEQLGLPYVTDQMIREAV